MRRFKPINQERRPVANGSIRRYWLGDVWAWEAFDAEGNRLPSIGLRSARQAVARVSEHAARLQETAGDSASGK